MKAVTLRGVAVLLFTAALAGCSVAPKVQMTDAVETAVWKQHQQVMMAYDDWSLYAKVSFRQGNKINTAQMNWTQKQQDYDIQLSGPFGQGGARIYGTEGYVRIDIAGEGSYSAVSPERLVYKTLGLTLPVSQIIYWVRGIPSPEEPYTPFIEQNQLKNLHQSGWQIEYLRYADNGKLTLPSKLKLVNDDLQIAMVIKSWSDQTID